MIIGIGTDIVEIKLIEESIKCNQRFVHRIFTQNEIDYCESKAIKHQHYAARFAAKEAMMKALGRGWNNIRWTQIEILNEKSGKPGILFKGDSLSALNDCSVHVSLSHSDQFATAFVIIENS